MEQVKPIGEWILIRPEQKPKMQGLLHLPETTKEKRCRGTVLAVGSGKILDSGVRVAAEVKPGDVVIFLQHNLLQGVSRASDEEGDGLLPVGEVIAILEETPS